MTRAYAKAIQDKVNSFLSKCDFDPNLDGTLPYANTLCILRYEPQEHRQESMGEDGQEVSQEKEKKLKPIDQL